MKTVYLDLDNTLIYSWKHDIGQDKRMVELYQGREISFMTEKTWCLLQEVRQEYTVIPTTTRTKEQYDRIDLGGGSFPLALVCNGGHLLINGSMDTSWYEASKKLIAASEGEMQKGIRYLETAKERYFEIRFPDELFVFTKCHQPEQVISRLEQILDPASVNVFGNGEKVYIVPCSLDKGSAVKRLQERLGAEEILAAGDSLFDLPMVCAADCGIVPAGFRERYGCTGKDTVTEMPQDALFSEALLEYILKRGRKGR